MDKKIEKAKAKRDIKALAKLLLKSKDSSQRLRAAAALGELGEKESFDFLQKAMNDEEDFVANTAAKSLVMVGGEDAIQSILYALSRHTIDKLGAENALKVLGEKAFPALIAAYKSTNIRFDLADLMKSLDCVSGAPLIKKDLEEGKFDAYGTEYLWRFVNKYVS
ncbi:MAG: HEAT repeat domain-containing protein [Spirochaetales bacterium]|nr:HEAT repeat domain-containing protein [Spirochaetales bacterium]